MIQSVLRYAAILLVALSLLAPLTSSWAMAVGLSEGRVLVICTGDGLRWIKIDAEGNPVEISHSAETCALVHAADTAAPPAVAPVALPPVDMAHGNLRQMPVAPDSRNLAFLARAPPLL